MMVELLGGNGVVFISLVEYFVFQKDCELMVKVWVVVEVQFLDENFFVDILVELFNMSCFNFYCKIKVLVGMLFNDYLKIICLNKVVELLKSGVCIIEVCEKIGFSFLFYFVKCFKIQFGVLLKDYY